MNKNKKIIIAIVAAIVLVCTVVLAVVIPSKSNEDKPGELITVTETVTDEQGEAVTDAQGEVVTEAVEAEVITQAGGEIVTEVVTNQSKQPYTQKNGSNVTRAVTKKPTNKNSTTKKTTTKKPGAGAENNEPSNTNNNNETPTNNDPTKPSEVKTQAKKPGKITGLKASDVKKDSMKISWDKLDCDKYEIRFGIGEDWGDPQSVTATSCILDKLTSYTEYTIQVRGINNSPGTPKGMSGDWATIKQRTEPNIENRNITITYELPVGSTGKIEVFVAEVDKDGKGDFPKNGEPFTVSKHKDTITTKKKYKGLVKVKIKYNDNEVISEITDKDSLKITMPGINIGIADGEDD